MKGITAKLIVAIMSLSLLADCSKGPLDQGKNMWGRIRVYLTDAPANFEAVNVTISEVSVHFSVTDQEEGQWVVIMDEPRIYDLLELTGGSEVLLGEKELKPGLYTQIRLKVESAEVVVDGNSHSLDVPSGAKTGIKLVREFRIEEDKLYEVLLDFDAERSVVETGSGKYLLKPTIRTIPLVISGTVSGKVLPLDAEAFISIYTADNDTVGTASADPSNGAFLVNAIPEGTYLVGINSKSGKYKDEELSGVEVIAQQNKDIGALTLETLSQ